MDQLVPGATQKVINALLLKLEISGRYGASPPLPPGPQSQVLQSLLAAFPSAHEMDHQNEVEGAKVTTDIRKLAPIRNPKVPGGDGYAGHLGDDYSATAGSVVLAPVSGTIRIFDRIYGGPGDNDGPFGPYGTLVAIEVTVPTGKPFAREGGSPRSIVGKKITVFLGHLDLDPAGRTPFLFAQGQYVTAGTPIGYVGTYVKDSSGRINLDASTGGSASDGTHVHDGILPWGIGMLGVNELPLIVTSTGYTAFPGRGGVTNSIPGFPGTGDLIMPPTTEAWMHIAD